MRRSLQSGLGAGLVLCTALSAIGVHTSAQAQTSVSAWQVSGQPGGRLVASIRSTGPTRGMSLTCERGVPLLLFAAPRGRGAAMGKLDLAAGSAASLAVAWNPTAGAWVATIGPRDRVVLDLLAGSASDVALTLSGQSLGSLPLTGSSNALRRALAACYTPPLVQAAPPGGASGGELSLPLRYGTYVRAGQRCGTGEMVFIDAGRGGAGNNVAGGGIESLRRTAANTYAVREDVGVQDTFVISAVYTIRDRENFTVKPQGEPAKTYRYCPLEALPPEMQEWPKGEHKEVPALPIRPGYYQFWQDGEVAGRFDCSMHCGYALISANGIVSVTYNESAPAPTRQAIRNGRVVQTGALGYRLSDRADPEGNSRWFRVRAPADFVEPDEMMGDTNYRSIDPARIPARYMPR